MEYYGTPGKDDNSYDENGILNEQGSIFSTLVLDGVAGYGYYEGTSMSCPHVSGVAALGLAYAKQQKRHFTSEEYRELLYQTARDIDHYFTGEKLFHMNHSSAGATPIKMNLEEYRGKMGRLIDAGALLHAIDGSGRPMRLPNLYIAPNDSSTLSVSTYVECDIESVSSADTTIAEAELKNDTLTVYGKGIGQTIITLQCTDGEKHTLTVTVRDGASDKGWL